MTAIKTAKLYSKTKVNLLRESLEGHCPANEIIVVCGSYAREEASAESDADWFAITSTPSKSKGESEQSESSLSWVDDARTVIGSIVRIEPAVGGAFANIEHRDAMIKNIGGDGDSNAKITRRMLFLLEGCPLTNGADFVSFRREILNRYVGEGISDHQLALFLLNDIIRYYRTMTVDYEFKTSEGDKPKPWGLRNIKLVFSRKLLYASGLFTVAQTANRHAGEKVRILEELLDLPVLDRMDAICGSRSTENIRARYDRFLDRLGDADVREKLKSLRREDRGDDELFRELKNEGHHFTRDLMRLYEQTFDSTHPIRRAVLF